MRRSTRSARGRCTPIPHIPRRGAGRLILTLRGGCRGRGVHATRADVHALGREPLYAAYGFRPLERLEDATGGTAVRLVRRKSVDRASSADSMPRAPELATGQCSRVDARKRRAHAHPRARSPIGPGLSLFSQRATALADQVADAWQAANPDLLRAQALGLAGWRVWRGPPRRTRPWVAPECKGFAAHVRGDGLHT